MQIFVLGFLCLTYSKAPCRGCWLALHSNKPAQKSFLEKYWTDSIGKHLFRKAIQSAKQLNTCFPFVRTFGPKIPVQMFAYLILIIPKLLCNIYQFGCPRPKNASVELKHRLDRERPTWKAFWKCWTGKLTSRHMCFSWFLLRKLVLLLLCMTRSH